MSGKEKEAEEKVLHRRATVFGEILVGKDQKKMRESFLTALNKPQLDSHVVLGTTVRQPRRL